MRNLVFGINITADGYCDHHLGIPDEAMIGYFTRLMNESGTLLYGRTTYELMFPYWLEVARTNSGNTKADNEFAHAFAAVPKVVVASKTLPQPEAANVTVIRSGLEREVLRLKKEPGKSISTGGVTLPSELLDLSLIDEFHIEAQLRAHNVADKEYIEFGSTLIETVASASNSYEMSENLGISREIIRRVSTSLRLLLVHSDKVLRPQP